MKKIFVTLFVGIFFLCVTIPSYARTTYYYSWITTCGFVIDREFSYELTDAHLFTVYKALYKLVYSEENY